MSVLARFRDLRLWFLILAAALIAAAVIKPTVRVEQNVYHYFAVFDITQSQNAEDVVVDGKPVSRLALAKHAMRAALRDLPCGSSVGIGLFAAYDTSATEDGYEDYVSGEPKNVASLFGPIEVCRNFSVIDRAIEAVDWRMAWNDSSDVTSGLYGTIQKAEKFGGKTNAVFFSDGETFMNFGVKFYPFPGKKGKVKGIIAGVGGLAPALIPKFDGLGNRAGFLKERSRLDESFLRKLEAETGLEYIRLESAEQFSAKLRAPEFAERAEADADIRLPLAALALLFVLLAVLF